MRVVTFVDHIDYDFDGNILKNAMCLGDIDNDGLSELIVGNEKGDLGVFKGASVKPVRVASGLGLISAVAVGDLLNNGRNVLVVISGCGQCHIFDFSCEAIMEKSEKKQIFPIHTQSIPANVKVVLIGDADGDGFSEMVVGLTDRVVRSYRWISAGNSVTDRVCGRLVGLNKWELAEQVGSITFNQGPDGRPRILVAQPGGTYFTLRMNPAGHEGELDPFSEKSELLTKSSLEYEPLASSRLRNPNIHTEILGNIKVKSGDCLGEGSPYAVATLDGTLMLVQKGDIKWSLQVDHQLFALSSLDVTGDGMEEVIACTWDGNTYIVHLSNECIRFVFPDAVNAFCAGMFAWKGEQVPSLVYATFQNCISLYYNVKVPYLRIPSLTEALKEHTNYEELLSELDIGNMDNEVRRSIHKYLLYHSKIR